MYLNNIKHINNVTITAPGVVGATKQTLIGPDQGWEGWVMRQFNLSPGGHTPRHSHSWPHINYILSGQGTLFLNGTEHQVAAGSVAYVPGGAEHQFMNAGNEEDFSFICIVPVEGDV